MNVEDARAALDKAIEFYGDCVKDGDTLEEKCQAEEIVDDAIEAYALAVLDEAFEAVRLGSNRDDLRTRIKAPPVS